MNRDWSYLKSGSDIRGNASTYKSSPPNLTPEMVKALGYSFALWLAENLGTTPDTLNIAVGHDARTTSPSLAQAAIEGLTSADCDVMDCGLCTTPAMFMTTISPETQADGAIMITASHHPSHKNGLKFTTKNGGLHGKDIQKIIQTAQNLKVPKRLVTSINFLEIYTDRLKQMVRDRLETDVALPLLGLHVVVDASNGVGGFYADLLKDLGADTTGSQFLDPDGRFPNHVPDPERPEAMQALADAVVRNSADLGVIFDADCDRAAIVDQDGRAINRNRLIALTAAILLDETPGATFVTDSVTSSGLAKFIGEWGGEHYRYKRGYRNVIDEAIRLNEENIDCPLAIETSGHAALRENYFLDDGMYLVTRLICEAMRRKREGLTLSSLIDDLQEPAESIELRLNLLPEDFRMAGQEIIDKLLNHTLENSEWRLAPDNREGVRISFDLDDELDSAWLLLRMSVHDPVMPLNAESDVPGGLYKILSELYALIGNDGNLDTTPLKQYLDAHSNQ